MFKKGNWNYTPKHFLKIKKQSETVSKMESRNTKRRKNGKNFLHLYDSFDPEFSRIFTKIFTKKCNLSIIKVRYSSFLYAKNYFNNYVIINNFFKSNFIWLIFISKKRLDKKSRRNNLSLSICNNILEDTFLHVYS